MAWTSLVLSPLLLLLLQLLPPPPSLLLLGTPLTLSPSRNLSSAPSLLCLSLGDRCGPGEYWSARHCCQCCPTGHYVEEPCSSPHAPSQCEACDAGTYTGHANGLRSCLLCDTCRPDQEMVSDCTLTHNRRCQCKTGEYYCDSESCPESCLPCTRCPQGKVVLQACTPTTDTQCGPAPPGAESRHRICWAAGGLCSVVAATFILLCSWKPAGGRGRAACCCPLAGCLSTELSYRRESLVPESSPGTREAGAPDPEAGACRPPEDSPGLPHPPPPHPRPEGQAEGLADLVGTKGPAAAAEEPRRPARLPRRLRDPLTTGRSAIRALPPWPTWLTG